MDHALVTTVARGRGVYVQCSPVLRVGHPQRTVVLKRRVERVALSPKELGRVNAHVAVAVSAFLAESLDQLPRAS